MTELSQEKKPLADLGMITNHDLPLNGKHIAALMAAEEPGAQKSQNQVIFLENFFDEVRRRTAAGSK